MTVEDLQELTVPWEGKPRVEPIASSDRLCLRRRMNARIDEIFRMIR